MKILCYKTLVPYGSWFSVSKDEQQPLAVGDYLIEWTDQFSYLGSVITDDGNIDAGVDKRIANVLKAFGALRQTVFTCPSILDAMCTRLVYYPPFCIVWEWMLDISLPSFEAIRWLSLQVHQDDVGHTNRQQWEEHILSATIRWWEDVDTIATKLRRHRLECLGHVARMVDHCLPRVCLDLKCDHFMDPREDGGMCWSQICSLLASVMAASMMARNRKQ